jgi:hypothetical protein
LKTIRSSVAILLSLVALGQGLAQSQQRGETIYKTFFNPKPVRAMDSAPSSYRVSGQEYLRLKKDSTDLYTGIRLLQANQPKKALPYLKRAAEHMQHTVINASEWYLALALLALKKIPEAQYLFHKIAETETHPYQDEAEIVYQRLVKK